MRRCAFASLISGLAAREARADGLAVTGQVTDAAGRALPGVIVVAETGPEGPPATTTTGDDGHYSLDLAPGRYRVSYRLLGYATQVAPRVAIEGISLDCP